MKRRPAKEKSGGGVTARAVGRFPHRKGGEALDSIAVEEPLEIRVNGRPLVVTMRTPGDDLDLAAGFLFTEGFIRKAGELKALDHGTAEDGGRATNIVEARLAADLAVEERRFFSSSSCGICGKAAIEQVFRNSAPIRSKLSVSPARLIALPATLRPKQSVFAATGGTHAAALFDAKGRLLAVREDVGRHNAVDKIVGARLRAGKPSFADLILLVSGRAGFEIVQKAAVAGIPFVCAVGAPTSLAADTAAKTGMTLVGFLRDGGFAIYSGEERIAGK